MYKYLPTDEEHIRIYGRTVKRDPLPLYWTASGVEFDTDSTEAYIDIECEYASMEYYLRVEIDGALIQRFLIPCGRIKYCLFKGFPEGTVRTVTVRMETQPFFDDKDRRLLIHEISTDRILQPVTPKTHRIEFIGDSLTSGEGLTGAQNIVDWFAGIYGLTGHYGLNVSKHFDAEYSIVSQSGWGVYCGWDNNIHTTVPSIYDKICGTYNDASWDFASWQPELVVVNLGTNDACAMGSPAWTDPETGTEWKLRSVDPGTVTGSDDRDPGSKMTGSDDRDSGNSSDQVSSGENLVRPELDSESKKRFEDAVYGFLGEIRRCNPGAYILWVYGMCGTVVELYIKETIEKYKTEAGDARVSYLSLPECPEEDFGSHFHPGPKNHGETAGLITDFVEKHGIFDPHVTSRE